MLKLTIFGLLIAFVLALPAMAIPTAQHSKAYENFNKGLNSYWWNSSVPPVSWKISNLSNNEKNSNISLALVTDKLDNGRSADIWAMDQNGQWHNKDINGKPMLLKAANSNAKGRKAGFSTTNSRKNKSLSRADDRSELTAFEIDPSWLDDGYIRVGAKYDNHDSSGGGGNGGGNNVNPGSGNGGTPGTGIGDDEVPPTVPLPGSILLSAIGLAVVGWLRRLRTI